MKLPVEADCWVREVLLARTEPLEQNPIALNGTGAWTIMTPFQKHKDAANTDIQVYSLCQNNPKGGKYGGGDGDGGGGVGIR